MVGIVPVNELNWTSLKTTRIREKKKKYKLEKENTSFPISGGWEQHLKLSHWVNCIQSPYEHKKTKRIQYWGKERKERKERKRKETNKRCEQMKVVSISVGNRSCEAIVINFRCEKKNVLTQKKRKEKEKRKSYKICQVSELDQFSDGIVSSQKNFLVHVPVTFVFN